MFQFADRTGGLGWSATLRLVAFVAFLAIGLDPVFWLLISEIYPLAVRGSAGGIGTPATLWLFGGCSVIALAYIYRTVPETSGRTLEGIEADLREATGTSADAWSDD